MKNDTSISIVISMLVWVGLGRFDWETLRKVVILVFAAQLFGWWLANEINKPG